MLLPVAKKNLDLYFFETNSINSINFFAGTRLVGPDPPIPKRIFFSFGLILNFFLAKKICFFPIFILGFGFTIYTGFDKLYLDTSGRLITERPQFFIALTLMLLGSQFFIAGFLGEIILKAQKRTKNYSIAETI